LSGISTPEVTRICDSAKARKALGWSAKIRPEEGIKRLIGWIEENRELFKQK